MASQLIGAPCVTAAASSCSALSVHWQKLFQEILKAPKSSILNVLREQVASSRYCHP